MSDRERYDELAQKLVVARAAVSGNEALTRDFYKPVERLLAAMVIVATDELTRSVDELARAVWDVGEAVHDHD